MRSGSEGKDKYKDIKPFRSPKSPLPLRPGRCFCLVMKTNTVDYKPVLSISKINDGLIEDPDLADGLVRQSEAVAAIKKAVEEAENVQKKAIDMMVQSCKDSNAAKITMSGKRPDGYIFETVVRKDGAVAFDEFSKEQLEEIRERFAKSIYKRNFSPEEGAEKELLQELSKKDLDVINVCQARLECPEFANLRQFMRNDSGWETIDDIPEATPEGLKEMCSACAHEGKCGIAPIKCWNEN